MKLQHAATMNLCDDQQTSDLRCVGAGLARVACLAMVVKLTRNKNLHVEEGSKPLECNCVNFQEGLSEAKVVPTIESTLLP